VEHG
jgi:hypothetical protein